MKELDYLDWLELMGFLIIFGFMSLYMHQLVNPLVAEVGFIISMIIGCILFKGVLQYWKKIVNWQRWAYLLQACLSILLAVFHYLGHY